MFSDYRGRQTQYIFLLKDYHARRAHTTPAVTNENLTAGNKSARKLFRLCGFIQRRNNCVQFTTALQENAVAASEAFCRMYVPPPKRSRKRTVTHAQNGCSADALFVVLDAPDMIDYQKEDLNLFRCGIFQYYYSTDFEGYLVVSTELWLSRFPGLKEKNKRLQHSRSSFSFLRLKILGLLKRIKISKGEIKWKENTLSTGFKSVLYKGNNHIPLLRMSNCRIRLPAIPIFLHT